MPAYMIVNYTVDNPELYAEYSAEAAPALNIGSDSQLIVFDTASEGLEGETGKQTVVLKFDSKEKARELRDSGAYQAVIGKRLEATSQHFCVLVDGLPE